jgi:predicted membrane chloride channel (bestrophin family)
LPPALLPVPQATAFEPAAVPLAQVSPALAGCERSARTAAPANKTALLKRKDERVRCMAIPPVKALRHQSFCAASLSA